MITENHDLEVEKRQYFLGQVQSQIGDLDEGSEDEDISAGNCSVYIGGWSESGLQLSTTHGINHRLH